MKRILVCIWSLLIIITLNMEAMGQQQGPDTSSAISQIYKAQTELPIHVLVYRWNDNPLAGFLVEVKGDTLTLLSSGYQEKISFPEIRTLTLIPERKENTPAGFLGGVLTCIYLLNLASYHAEDHPTAYYHKPHDDDRIVPTILMAGLGGALGALIGAAGADEIIFDFSGETAEAKSEWVRFRDYNKRESSPAKIHFSVQAAQVYSRVSNRYLPNSGYHKFSRYYYLVKEDATDFNLLRKFQVTYSLKPQADIGFAVVWFGEPTVWGSKTLAYDSPSAVQWLYATGYYAVGVYQPFYPRLKEPYQFKIGVGLGMADVNFKVQTQNYVDYYNQTTQYNKVTGKLLSGTIFAQFDLFLSHGFSLGLIGDYVFVPSRQSPNIPEAEIPAQKLRLGNGSLGITMGLHF